MHKVEIRTKQGQHNKDKKAYTYRMVILFSPEDVKVIDDWRFANRCSTRSEAVRKLMNLGLLKAGEKKSA